MKPMKKPKVKKIKKPKKRSFKDVYNWREIRDYINKKHRVDIDDFKGKFEATSSDAEYCNFWHWMLRGDSGIHNGSFTYLPVGERNLKEHPEWVRTILTWIWEDFCGSNKRMTDLEVWVDW